MEAHSLQVALARSAVKRNHTVGLRRKESNSPCDRNPTPADVLWTVLWIFDMNTMQESGTRGEGLYCIYTGRVTAGRLFFRYN